MAQVSSINGPCHFMNGSSRSAVALASFPGSGNTWARGLLEKATGVCTGTARGYSKWLYIPGLYRG